MIGKHLNGTLVLPWVKGLLFHSTIGFVIALTWLILKGNRKNTGALTR